MREIQAAGAVLWRRPKPSGGVEVAVIHRPEYDDWTLPKGKVDRGETAPEAALREVREETGREGSLGRHLGVTRYRKDGAPKVVHYWAMEAGPGRFEAHGEVDELRWLPLAEAEQTLTYDRDRDVLRRFADLVERP